MHDDCRTCLYSNSSELQNMHVYDVLEMVKFMFNRETMLNEPFFLLLKMRVSLDSADLLCSCRLI